jgi:hypothetical protein
MASMGEVMGVSLWFENLNVRDLGYLMETELK